jgi:hypothetical protein
LEKLVLVDKLGDEKMERYTLIIRNSEDSFLTLVDLWKPKGDMVIDEHGISFGTRTLNPMGEKRDYIPEEDRVAHLSFGHHAHTIRVS